MHADASGCQTNGFPVFYGGFDGSTILEGVDMGTSNDILVCGYSDSQSLINNSGLRPPIMAKISPAGNYYW